MLDFQELKTVELWANRAIYAESALRIISARSREPLILQLAKQTLLASETLDQLYHRNPLIFPPQRER